jgi:hypothetical protein
MGSAITIQIHGSKVGTGLGWASFAWSFHHLLSAFTIGIINQGDNEVEGLSGVALLVGYRD